MAELSSLFQAKSSPLKYACMWRAVLSIMAAHAINPGCTRLNNSVTTNPSLSGFCKGLYALKQRKILVSWSQCCCSHLAHVRLSRHLFAPPAASHQKIEESRREMNEQQRVIDSLHSEILTLIAAKQG